MIIICDGEKGVDKFELPLSRDVVKDLWNKCVYFSFGYVFYQGFLPHFDYSLLKLLDFFFEEKDKSV